MERLDRNDLLAHRDPFSNRFTPPKIEDGKASMSSAVKLRMAGQVTMPTAAGASVTLCIGPGLSSNFYPVDGLPALNKDEPIYQAHFGTQALRNTIKQIRLVGTAARFSLLNNADQNEGYWEAIRVPFTWNDISLVARDDPVTEPVTGALDFSGVIAAAGNDFSQHSTYQTGKLKDLHKYQFKLNSTTTEHPFTDPSTIGDGLNGPTEPQVRGFIDETFDIVLVRVFGRNEASFPSVLRYEVVSNQEIVWKETSQTARLMTRSKMSPMVNTLLNSSNYDFPGIKFQ